MTDDSRYIRRIEFLNLPFTDFGSIYVYPTTDQNTDL